MEHMTEAAWLVLGLVMGAIVLGLAWLVWDHSRYHREQQAKRAERKLQALEMARRKRQFAEELGLYTENLEVGLGLKPPRKEDLDVSVDWDRLEGGNSMRRKR